MSRNPMLSPTHADNDLLILEGVLRGVRQHGAEYGLSHPRRELLDLTLQTLLYSMQDGWEDDFAQAVCTLLTGRPSPPQGRDDGHRDVSAPPPLLPG